MLALVFYASQFCVLAACSNYQPGNQVPVRNDIRTQSQHQLTVSTTLLTDAQAQSLYGVDLAEVGLQAIWLRIDNRSDHSHWLLVAALDPSYFAPGEAAALFQPRFFGADDERITRQFHQLAMPLKSTAGAVTEGYVLAPRQEGGRYLGVTLVGEQHAVHFDFSVTLPDGNFDFERLKPEQIYIGQERPDLDREQLRERLRALPCCAEDEEGAAIGDPLNLVLLGNAAEVLSGLSRGGWSFTHRIDTDTVQRLIGAAISGAAYPVAPVSPLYLFGRPQDIAVQRARNTILQRNHIRLWLAPFRFEGRSVWLGQVSRVVSIKPTTRSRNLVTHVIDANVDESREHLLQSLMVAGVVKRFAFVQGVGVSSSEAPASNLTDDAYYTDGLRLVAEISGRESTPLEAIEFIGWQDSPDPMRNTDWPRCLPTAVQPCPGLLPPGVSDQEVAADEAAAVPVSVQGEASRRGQ
ncbi:LssY C-terminal domain-containing protein [Parahaliea aestuarii]